MIHADDELAKWQEQWQAQPPVPIELRQRVDRDIRGRRLAMLGSIAVTVVMGGGTTLWVARSGEPHLWTLAVITWVFIAVAWVLTLQVERTRGPWRPLTETTGAFIEYAIQSRRARRQAIKASAILYLVFFMFVLVWRYRTVAGSLDPWSYVASARVLILLAISGALAVVATFQHRRLHRELHNLEKMRAFLSIPQG